jgi:hypothetical protein
MAFDGNHYNSGPIIPPYAYHPHAPATGDALQGVIEQAYFYARNASRLVGVQTYLYTLKAQTLWSSTALSYAFSKTDFVDVARFQRFIPKQATHLSAVIDFRPILLDAARIRARIEVTDGTDTDIGETVEIEFPAGQTIDAGIIDPYNAASNALGTMKVDVALADVTPNQTLIVTVKMFAFGPTDVTAQRIRPELVTCWWEVVDQ